MGGKPGSFAAWLAEHEELDGAALSSVANPELTAEVVDLIQDRTPHFDPDQDPRVANRTREPESVGRDRLFAARGGFTLVGGSCVVVDAGTAVTVDAVLELGEGEAAFLGGAIAPGPFLKGRALARETVHLPEVELVPTTSALGRTTEAAIQAGLVVGFRGAVRELVHGVAQEAGLEEPPIVLTGGARSFLLLPEPVFGGTVHEQAELVHLGLLSSNPPSAPPSEDG